jgi:acyl carrier protein
MLEPDILSRIKTLLTDLFGEDRFGNTHIGRNTGLYDELGLKSLEVVTLLGEVESTLGLNEAVDRIPVTELVRMGDIVDRVPGATRRPSRADPVLESLSRGARRRRTR